jgi:primary-amine oxidase
VVSSIHTVGNYEYAFYWYFHEDGTIAHDVKMTGILQTKAVDGHGADAHATVVAPGLAAPHHQHLFCMRLHWDLDGGPNTVVEVDVLPDPPGSDNPFANGFHTAETVIERESDGPRKVDAARSRTWMVQNRSITNGLGQPPSYRLVPGPTPTLLAGEGSMIRRRAAFATANLWVTPWAPGEDRAAGDYPNQHDGNDGLPRFVTQDRPVADADVVMWHTYGLTHVARPEDWPVMPTEPVGFSLVPFGFFDRNPALDVAPSAAHCEP